VRQRGGHSVPSRRWVDGQAPKMELIRHHDG
jgi:hypothetical protein